MLASYGRRLLMVAVAATLVGCSSVESSGSVIVESVSTLSVGEGEAVVRIVATAESDTMQVGETAPTRFPLTNASFWVIPTEQVDDFWSLLIADEIQRPETVRGAMTMTGSTPALVSEADWLVGPGQLAKIDSEQGLVEVALRPGDYLVCRLKAGGDLPDGAGRAVSLSFCGELGVIGETTWTYHASSGEVATSVSMKSAPTVD